MAKSKFTIRYTRSAGVFKYKTKEVFAKAADLSIEAVIQNIFDEKKPDRSRQKRNKRVTVEAKRRRGVRPPNRPLYGFQRLLVKKSTYRKRFRIGRISSSFTISIKPVRNSIVRHLGKKGYEFMGVPKRKQAEISKVVNQELKAALRRSTRGKKISKFATS